MSDRVELPAEILQSVGTWEAAIAQRGRIKTGAADGGKTSAELFKLYMRLSLGMFGMPSRLVAFYGGIRRPSTTKATERAWRFGLSGSKCQPSRKPRFRAIITACVRSFALSFERTLFMFAFTAASDTLSWEAIALLE